MTTERPPPLPLIAGARHFAVTWYERFRAHENLFASVMAVIIGVACGLAAVAFRHLIELVQFLMWGYPDVSFTAARSTAPWRILAVPAAGGLIVGFLVWRFASEARGHGVPEVMAAVATRNGVIRPRIVIVKALASAITIGSGGSAGREGPIIQIGSAIGSSLGQLLKVSSRWMRTFVGCGAAAGIAATFNAPIAGALFSLEVILGDFGVTQFSPIVIASVLSTVVARHYLGEGSVFAAPQYRLASGVELLPYLVLGLVCGLVSAAYIRALYKVEDFCEGPAGRRVPAYLQPMVGGFLVGAIGLLMPQVFGDGHDVVNYALFGGYVPFMLFAMLLGKVAATSLTLGTGGSGGVFAPSLFMGAMAGGLIGQLSRTLLGDMAGPAGGYALVGMGGLVAGTTRAPITAILIIFEITNNYSIILPLMMVCIISTVVCTKLSRESIYTMKLVRRGIDLFRGRSPDVLRDRRAGAYARKAFACVPANLPLNDVFQTLIRSDHSQLYVTDANTRLLGVITLGVIRKALPGRADLHTALLAEDVADASVPFCTEPESLSDALVKLARSGLTELPVVGDAGLRHLVGVLHYADVIGAYREEILKEDTAGELAQRIVDTAGGGVASIAAGYSIAEWDPPSGLWGMSLRQANLPNRYGVRVLLVKKKGAEAAAMPTFPATDYRITEQDILVIYGKDEDIEKVRRL